MNYFDKKLICFREKSNHVCLTDNHFLEENFMTAPSLPKIKPNQSGRDSSPYSMPPQNPGQIFSSIVRCINFG
jgi:hypothetical protein